MSADRIRYKGLLRTPREKFVQRTQQFEGGESGLLLRVTTKRRFKRGKEVAAYTHDGEKWKIVGTHVLNVPSAWRDKKAIKVTAKKINDEGLEEAFNPKLQRSRSPGVSAPDLSLLFFPGGFVVVPDLRRRR